MAKKKEADGIDFGEVDEKDMTDSDGSGTSDEPESEKKDTDQTEETTKPDGDDQYAKMQETINSLQETIESQSEKMSSLEKSLTEQTETLPPEKPEPQDQVPKTWDEVDDRYRKLARKEYDSLRKKEIQSEQEKKKEAESHQKKIDDYLDGQLTKLEKLGKIPKIDSESADDPGRIERKKLLTYALKNETSNIVAASESFNMIRESGYDWDFVNRKWVKSDTEHKGASAPVSKGSGGDRPKGKMSYTELHDLSLDSLIEKYS